MILDTNALSALASRDKGLIAAIGTAPEIAVTLISLGEYHFGLSGSRNKEELAGWLSAFLKHAKVLSPSLDTLPHYADIRRELKQAGTPIPANDCWIAALARQYAMPIVSRDTHFDAVAGLHRIGW